jgi:hypothetical protein
MGANAGSKATEGAQASDTMSGGRLIAVGAGARWAAAGDATAISAITGSCRIFIATY